jgi:O-antigen ligase
MGGLLEAVVLVHVGVMVVGTSWAFGGQAPWIRTALLVWGNIGILLLAVASVRRELSRPGERFTPLRDLWPLLLFDVCVGASCFNPGFETFVREGETFFVVSDPPWAWLPSTARPDLTLRSLWLFNGIVLSCYNVGLVVQRRRGLRLLVGVIVANAALLAIFGTLQKLARADGLWFGLVESPQSYFFSTFVYHNHWGAFTLLNLAACLGLLFHFLRRGGESEPWNSPVLVVALAALLLAASVPLSASRSSSALACILLFGAAVHFLVRLIRRRREHQESPLLPVAGIALGSLLALAAVLYLARDVIRQRAELTVEQVTRIKTEDRLDTRLELYRDTWRMAMDKPWFGWGLDTYGDVFRIYNTFPTPVQGGFKPYYREAHNDWLQSLAETGFVGTVLLGLLGVVPLLRAPWRDSRAALPRYLLAGCALVLLYATFEFPFANPSVAIAFWSGLFIARRYLVLDARLG